MAERSRRERDQLARDGFVVLERVAPESLLDAVRSTLDEREGTGVHRLGTRFAARNLLREPLVAELASGLLGSLARDLELDATLIPVKATLFDKREGENWPLALHQDQIISVAERREVPFFESWTIKGGVPHVRPPTELIERMLALRLHLDDATEDNGALRAVPGSHRLGRLSDAELVGLVQDAEPIEARCGEVLAMRPLLVHGSRRAKTARRRRVLHVEYAPAGILPDGLAWPR